MRPMISNLTETKIRAGILTGLLEGAVKSRQPSLPAG